MKAREQLEYVYALAFDPPTLNALWNQVKDGRIKQTGEAVKLVDMALKLHQALPEEGYSSQRALRRLAIYQARARAFGMPRFLGNIRRALGVKRPRVEGQVPAGMVRDIPLPEFCHHARSCGRAKNNKRS
jgi:hypothetical protein